jgi:hypothetical protein
MGCDAALIAKPPSRQAGPRIETPECVAPGRVILAFSRLGDQRGRPALRSTGKEFRMRLP